MVHSFQKKIWLSLCVLFLMGAIVAPSISQAGPIRAAYKMQEKQKLLKFLADRLQKHETMKLEDIREDLLISLRKNRDALEAQRSDALDDKVVRAIEVSEQSILNLQDKQEIIDLEKQQITELVSAHNFIFGFTMGMLAHAALPPVKGGQPPEAVSKYLCHTNAWMIVTVPLDLITLPFALIGSVISGF